MDMDDAYGSNTTTPNEFEEGDSFSVERLRMSLVAMIIIDKLPFSYVEREGFLEFMATVEPRFPILDHVTVAKDCIKLYLREKEELKRMLAGRRVCLTILIGGPHCKTLTIFVLLPISLTVIGTIRKKF